MPPPRQTRVPLELERSDPQQTLADSFATGHRPHARRSDARTVEAGARTGRLSLAPVGSRGATDESGLDRGCTTAQRCPANPGANNSAPRDESCESGLRRSVAQLVGDDMSRSSCPPHQLGPPRRRWTESGASSRESTNVNHRSAIATNQCGHTTSTTARTRPAAPSRTPGSAQAPSPRLTRPKTLESRYMARERRPSTCATQQRSTAPVSGKRHAAPISTGRRFSARLSQYGMRGACVDAGGTHFEPREKEETGSFDAR